MAFNSYRRGLSRPSRTHVGAEDLGARRGSMEETDLNRAGREELEFLEREKTRWWAGAVSVDPVSNRVVSISHTYPDSTTAVKWYNMAMAMPHTLYAAMWDTQFKRMMVEYRDPSYKGEDLVPLGMPRTGEPEDVNVDEEEPVSRPDQVVDEPVDVEMVTEDRGEELAEPGPSGTSTGLAAMGVGAALVIGGIVVGSKGKRKRSGKIKV